MMWRSRYVAYAKNLARRGPGSPPFKLAMYNPSPSTHHARSNPLGYVKSAKKRITHYAQRGLGTRNIQYDASNATKTILHCNGYLQRNHHYGSRYKKSSAQSSRVDLSSYTGAAVSLETNSRHWWRQCCVSKRQKSNHLQGKDTQSTSMRST